MAWLGVLPQPHRSSGFAFAITDDDPLSQAQIYR
jgi:hypothetical protein